MSSSIGSNQISNGLVFQYDMNNTQKSWIGRPYTNQFVLPTADSNGFSVQNDTFYRIRTGTYGGYDIQPTDYVWKYNINGGACPYHGNDISITAGYTATFTFDFYISPATIGYPSSNFLAAFEGVTNGAIGDPTPSIVGVWKTLTFTATASSTGNCRMLLYPGGCGTQLATGTGFILYKNPRVEFNAPGSSSVSFAAGTRSNAQAVLDLTGNNTITTQSLTYNSDGTFSFSNASTNYMDVSGSGFASMANYTICYWAKRNLTHKMPVAGRTSTAFYWFGDYSWAYTHGGTWGEYYYPKSVSIPDGVWGFFCVVYDGSYVNIYRNAVFEGRQATSGSADWSQGMKIGSWASSASYSWDGSISSVSMYNRALSAAEVSQNFQATRSRFGI